jgi:hypothetical protein
VNSQTERASDDGDWPLPSAEVIHELQGPEVVWQPEANIDGDPVQAPIDQRS